MNTSFLVLTPTKIPVSKTLDSRKWVIALAEKAARLNLFKKNSLLRVFVKREVIR